MAQCTKSWSPLGRTAESITSSLLFSILGMHSCFLGGRPLKPPLCWKIHRSSRSTWPLQRRDPLLSVVHCSASALTCIQKQKKTQEQTVVVCVLYMALGSSQYSLVHFERQRATSDIAPLLALCLPLHPDSTGTCMWHKLLPLLNEAIQASVAEPWKTEWLFLNAWVRQQLLCKLAVL